MTTNNETWSREVSQCLGSINTNLENVNRQLELIHRKLSYHDNEIERLKRERSYFLGAGAAFGTIISFVAWAIITLSGG